MQQSNFLRALLLAVLILSATVCLAQPRVVSLDELFTLAEQNSKTIDAERIALRASEAKLRESESQRLPDVEISASASYLGNGTLTERNWSNPTNVKMPHFGNNFALEASQLIYGGGVVSSAIALSKLECEMASINLEDARSRVRFLLVGFYLDLAKLQNIVRVYDRNIALAEELIADTEARSREGVALSNDVTRQQLRLEQLRLARAEVANSQRILQSQIATLVGLDPNTEILPEAGLAEREMPFEGESHWQQLALEHTPALRRGEVAVDMSLEAERIARSERLPSVALVAANHFDGPITIEVPTINKNFNYWYVGVGVSFKLSSLYKSNHKVEHQCIATEHSRRELDQLLDDINLAIHADYIRYEEARLRVETMRKSLELAQSNYRVVEKRYRNDIALITDMIDASNQLLDAELQLENSQIALQLRYYKLQHTSGTL